MNRNWDMEWGIGASTNPCSDVFQGPTPFSEPETLGLSDLMSKVGHLDLFITLHSYGQAVLYPWGFTEERAHGNAALKRWDLNIRMVLIKKNDVFNIYLSFSSRHIIM